MLLSSGIWWTTEELHELCTSKYVLKRCLGRGLKTTIEVGTTATVSALLVSILFSIGYYGLAIDFDFVTAKRSTSLLYIYGFVTSTLWYELSCFTTEGQPVGEGTTEASKATDQETDDRKATEEGNEEEAKEREPVETEA